MERLHATLSRCFTLSCSAEMCYFYKTKVHLYVLVLCLSAGPNTFDSPSYVAAAMAGSLAGVMDVVSPDFKKQSRSQQGSKL